MKPFISSLIEDQADKYKREYHQMVADFNQETATVKGYNGRQVLELLQNCDDEGAKVVYIALDQEQKTISISNNGTPFSQKGYRSLFIANLSSKTAARKYIGNKGLGFRSIINWSNTIEIQSNNISLLYSEDNKQGNFDNLFDENLKQTIRTEYGFNENAYPIPFLSMPIYREIQQGNVVTSIIIHYKEEYLDDIIKQVNNITAETLLFLRNIEQVNFSGFTNREDILCLKEPINEQLDTFLPKQRVVYEEGNWEIFVEDKELPIGLSDTNKEEKEHYQIKIAVEENLRQNTSYLYSFFPTNIQLRQPYILHATFDLDPTRNQVVDSAKNRYILEKVVEFTIKVSKYYAGNKVSYRPLEILHHKHQADSLSNLGYYDLIRKAIRNEEIFPCLDNSYRKLDDTIFVSNKFAQMLIDISASDELGFHLIPTADEKLNLIISSLRIDGLDTVTDPLELINEIAALPLTKKQRANFISNIVLECGFLKEKYPNKFNILVNYKNDVLKGEEYIYTPITNDEELKVPHFTEIQFLDRELFDELLDYLDYKATDNAVKSRFIYESLRGFCNIHSYEPATLSQKIISETKNRISANTPNPKADVIEMTQCLFHNFKRLDETTQNTTIKAGAPTITKSGKIKTIDNLVLSSSYPLGKLTDQIFEGVYTQDNFIAGPIEIGIDEGEDIHEVEAFLKWLGVNRFAKYITNVTRTQLSDYRSYVLDRKYISYTTYEISYTDILDFEKIVEKMPLNQLITWIYYDETLKKQMNDSNNSDVFRRYYRIWQPPISDKPSYLKYILSIKKCKNFSEHLLDEKYLWVNNLIVDYRASIFQHNEISKTSINEILILLGATEDFNSLPIQRVAEIINKIPEKYPDGKKSQSLYKKALSHYRANYEEIESPIKLFADNGQGLKLYQPEEIYFSDKIKLPKKLKPEFPILNFPVRSGGAEAIDFFGINDLKDVKITLQSFERLSSLTEEFREYLGKLKPLVLTQRINVIESDDQRKDQASICNRIEIILCADIQYKVQATEYTVSDYEFLRVADYTYYVKVDKYDSLKTIRRNPSFIESFADIIAVSFDLSGEKNEFKFLIRNDLEDALLSIKNDFGEDTLQEARELLGLSDFKQAFWEAVLTAKGVSYQEQLDDVALEKLISDQLAIDFKVQSIDYENINDESEVQKVLSLFDLIALTVKDFANNYPYQFSLKGRYFKLIRNAILGNKKLIKSSIWHALEEDDIDKKAKFLSQINVFEDYEDYVNVKSIEIQHESYLDIEQIVNEYIKSLYGSLELIKDDSPDKQKAINSRSFTSDERYLINQNERLKSLLFFEGTTDVIKKELIDITSIDRGETPEVIVKPASVEVLSSDILTPKTASQNGKPRKGVFTPKESNGRKKKDVGNTSEQIVYDELCRKYTNVDWVSQDNEGLHYDIRYTNEDNMIKYVEVKTFDNGCFHLSKPEFDFGSIHKDDYEVWLVTNQKYIIPIKDFFTNTKYQPIANEYLIYLNLDKN